MGVDLLGQVPLEMAVREGGDSGEPVVVRNVGSATAVALTQLAQVVAARLAILNHAKPQPFKVDPNLRLM
jgi:ATP-binding protein involved in chromosome partitioning